MSKHPDRELTQRIEDLTATVGIYDDLFWLATQDVVFFSLAESGWYAAILVNDRFCCGADAEELALSDVSYVRALYEKFGSDGVDAFVSSKRGWFLPVKGPITQSFKDAVEEIKAGTKHE